MLIMRGPLALTHFRLERWLKQINYVVPQVSSLSAEFIHFIDLKEQLTKQENRVLSELLQYGIRPEEPIQLEEIEKIKEKELEKREAIEEAEEVAELNGFRQIETEQSPQPVLFYILPRPGTVSAWSSKATDIAHHCGLKKIRRIERGIVYAIQSDDNMTWGDEQAIGRLLQDPFTECVIYKLAEAKYLFQERQPRFLYLVDILNEGRSAIIASNEQLKLGLTEKEMDYILEIFQTLKRNPTDVELMMLALQNSEHCGHHIFHMQWIIDGLLKTQSLFSMIQNTQMVNPRGMLSTLQENAAIIDCGKAGYFSPDPTSHQYQYHLENLPMVIKVVSNNHPTCISPYSGAATCVGKEIRDETAAGRGANPKAGLCGFSVSNLNIPGFQQPWEIEDYGKPKQLVSALEIILEAPLGTAQFNNQFGRPNICGYFRTFEQRVSLGSGDEIRGYHKPIILSGGLANIRYSQIHKQTLKPNHIIVVLGGPGMLIGLGAAVAASHNTKIKDEILEIGSVQQCDPEMQRRCQEVINACTALGLKNPIISMQDISAGGVANALAKLIHQSKVGVLCELRELPMVDILLSPLEIACNEAQERFLLVMEESHLEQFTMIAEREYCPYAVIGTLDASQNIKLTDRFFNEVAADLPLPLLVGKIPRPRLETANQVQSLPALKLNRIDLSDALFRLLHLPCIADKSFLITIQDRGVGGLVARDPMVGPWQVPVADCAVVARSFDSYEGEAISMGEKAPLALINAAASARMAVGEAITNIAAACIGVLSDIRLSANWMVACGNPIEEAHLYEAVEAIGMTLCPELGVAIVVGKDSLSMQTRWHENNEEKSVTAPLSLVISAFAPVMDIRQTLTPVLVSDRETVLIFIDLSNGNQRLGGSALATVYNQLGDDVPDVEDIQVLKGFFASLQRLNLERKILAYHDRSDGGLLITLCEMAFASHLGLQIDISDLGENPISILFNEELGAVIQVRVKDIESVLTELVDNGVKRSTIIGTIEERDEISIGFNKEIIFSADRILLQKAWSETNFHIQALRDNPRCAKKQYDTIGDRDDPGLNNYLTFDLNEDITAPFINMGVRPRMAILREQGVQGNNEMAAAFDRAAFDCIDVHMNDLQAGNVSLVSFKGLAVCGGFSFGDVLGAGLGWAKRILFNANLREQFESFFNRPDTFTLGVSNGCQMLSHLKALIPGAELWPVFIQNYSEQFEGRLCLVEVQPSPSLFLRDMVGSQLVVPVANAEGRAEFSNETIQEEALKLELVALRYVDNHGRKTKIYPANPSGSSLGISGLTTLDGRVTILMPQPERAFRTVQYSWYPDSWGEDGPWLRFFRNARIWV
jgi:phosphoribosylformylglycinamidine synthase